MIKIKFIEDIIFREKKYRANEEYSFNNEEFEEILKLNIKVVFLPIKQFVNYKTKPIHF